MTGFIVATTEDGRTGWLREAGGVRHFRFIVAKGPAATLGDRREFRLVRVLADAAQPIAVLTSTKKAT